MSIQDQITGLTERTQTWWSEAPTPQKSGAIVGAVILVVGLAFAFMSMGGGREDWEPSILYANLDYAEAAEITTRLAQLDVPHKLTDDASTIVVPSDKVREMRLVLAADGFPKSGHIGYEIFDDGQLAMTDFLQRVNLVRAMQGELEETLRGLEGVKVARVHLVTPEPSLFTEEQNPVTAAVTLTLTGDAKLKPRQIEAIGHLVSASVEGLDIANVAIVDSEGNMLSEERDPLAKAASRQFEQQQMVERALEKKVQTLLDEVIGQNRSEVRINVSLDFSQRTTQSSNVDPGGSQIVISEETSESQSAEQGTEENSVRNYEVNRTVQNIVGSVGQVAKMTMALTVDATKVVPVEGQPGQFEEAVREASEIDKLKQLAQQAVGFDASRGDEVTVFALRFDKSQELQAKEEAVAEERKEFWTGIAINVAKVLGILGALITLRFIIQAIGRGVGVEEEIEVLGEVEDIEEQEFERPETPHDIILSRVQQMVRDKPEDAAKLIRTMLVEEAG